MGALPTFTGLWAAFASLHGDQLKSYAQHHGKGQMFYAVVRKGDTLFVPAGYIVAESIESEVSSGIKAHVLGPSQAKTLEAIASELTIRAGKHHKSTLLVEAAVAACQSLGASREKFMEEKRQWEAQKLKRKEIDEKIRLDAEARKKNAERAHSGAPAAPPATAAPGSDAKKLQEDNKGKAGELGEEAVKKSRKEAEEAEKRKKKELEEAAEKKKRKEADEADKKKKKEGEEADKRKKKEADEAERKKKEIEKKKESEKKKETDEAEKRRKKEAEEADKVPKKDPQEAEIGKKKTAANGADMIDTKEGEAQAAKKDASELGQEGAVVREAGQAASGLGAPAHIAQQENDKKRKLVDGAVESATKRKPST